jgi:hypothetical protein
MLRTRPRLPPRKTLLVAALAASWTAALPSASAQSFDFHAQGQAIALGAMSLPDADFGVVELQVNGSIMSFGVAAGVAFERFPGPDETTLYAGIFHLAFQWRFLALLEDDLYKWFDPHVDLGFVLGGARDGGGESYFRGAGYGGVGLDVKVFGTDEGQLVFTVQYRWTPNALHDPDSAPDHLLLFGLGARYGGG